MKINKVWVGAIAVAVACAALAGASVPRRDKIAAGVKAAGVKIGRLDAKEAEELLKKELSSSPQGTVVIQIGQTKKEISLDEADMSYDFKNTVEKAMSVGRQGGGIKSAWDSSAAFLFGKNIEASVVCDSKQFAEYIREKVKDTGNEVTEYTYELGDGVIKITNGKPGDVPDSALIAEDVLKAVGKGKTHKPLKYAKKEHLPKKVDIDGLYDKLHGEMRNAEYVITDGKVVVREHKAQVDFDKAEAKKIAESKNGFGESFEIPATIRMPDLTKEEAEERIFANVLGSYSTRYNAGEVSRSENVALAAKSINNLILAPGEEFSYNGTVGERTSERGYKTAKVFVNGESVDGIGGGICQVSTTLYNAVLYANLEIVERMNHQLPVSYVPLGQDATVFYGSIDFRFKNNTNYPAKIVANAGGGTLKIDILGYKEDKSLRVIIENETISVSEPKIKEIEDETMPEGETRIVKKGSSGAVVDTFKTVVRDGKDPVRTRISRSVYNPTTQEVHVGTAPKEEEATEDSSEDVVNTEQNLEADTETAQQDVISQ